MPSVLFVCTANRFRSPLAASFLLAQLNSRNIEGWFVSSAGTWTEPGYPPLDSAVRIARSYGLDITSHKSSPLTRTKLEASDLILVMEKNHKEAMLIEYPFITDRIYLLSEAAENKIYDIPDPFAWNETPEDIGKELYSLIETGFQSIFNLII